VSDKPSYAPPPREQVERAARLCFSDICTDAQIAAELGICRRTLARWKRRREFLAFGTTLDAEYRRPWTPIGDGVAQR
jgi:Helix-turn-helix domain